MVEWSRAFGNIPIYLHKDDARWVMRPDPCIEFWEGETKILPGGLTLIRCGGHFDGGTVLHWPSGAGGSGALLTGDIIQVVPDRRFVSFMYSYPNYIPLGAAAVRRIVNTVEPLPFDRIYGAFPGLTVTAGARAALKRSAERYLKAIQ
jgi:glyoxylase-like metal-dependent hydrolase (beta-lactamase superfamily II)